METPAFEKSELSGKVGTAIARRARMRSGLPSLASVALLTGGLAVGLFAVGCADAGPPPSPESNDAVSVPKMPEHIVEGPDESPAPAETAPPQSLANIGDSISQGFDADDSEPLDVSKLATDPAAVFKDNPALSWVQGSDPRVASVLQHFRAQNPALVHTALSQAGAELVAVHNGIPNLEAQAKAIATKGVTPDLVYVLLGGNDVCNRPRSTTDDPTATLYTVDQWRTAALRGLDALVAVLPPGATVRFVSMPRVDMLYEAAGDLEVPTKGDGPVAVTTTCKSLWTASAQAMGGLCPVVTLESSATKRRAIGDRVDAYNEVLAEEVRKLTGDAARNPKGVVFQSDWHGALGKGGVDNTSGGTFVFEPKHVSKRDCFHPSIEGQNALAFTALKRANWAP